MADRFDLVIIGAGPAGYIAAKEAAGRGMRTALIENRELGGTCLNRGCIPTKTLLHGAELYTGAAKGETFGIHAGELSCDMRALQRRKTEVTEQLQSGIASLMKKSRVEVICGTGTILSAHLVRVQTKAAGVETGNAECRKEEAAGAETGNAECREGETAEAEYRDLETEYILVATGSLPAVLPISGSQLENVLTSDGLLSREERYPSLTIIGGGVIGMEFASIYSALGAKVTVIEYLDRILANMDKEISQNLKMILKKRGVEIHTGARVEEIRKDESGKLVCCYTEKETAQEAESDGILMATGRRANTEGLFGENFSLEMERGRIVVNPFGQTSVPNIYAAGDVSGKVQLAHAASAEAVNAVAHMAFLRTEKKLANPGMETDFIPTMRLDLIPGCVYTDPEIGTVGLTQEEAKAQGLAVIVKKYPMSANGKSVLTGQERGFVKVLADQENHKILGAQMMCARATDMISEFTLAISAGLTLEQMGAIIHPHPTFSEGIGEALHS